jgi:hypothetical protein
VRPTRGGGSTKETFRARHLSALIAFISLALLTGCSSGAAGAVKLGVDVAAE